MSKKEVTKLKRLIREYMQWAVAYSWRGGGDPDNIPMIENEFRKARKRLFDFLKMVQDGTSNNSKSKR